jgi:hypothetical protein
MSVWKALEKTLARGDNIQEGHYAERSWARLLSTPLRKYQAEALWRYTMNVQRANFGVHGALIGEVDHSDITFMNLNDYKEKQRPKNRGRFVPLP